MTVRSPLVWLALCAFVAAVPLLAREVAGIAGARRPVFPYAITSADLENGLRVVVVPMDSPGIVAHYVAVRAGSRNEVEPGLSGFAHFFEHMMFRGTERYPAEKYNDALKRLGADSNAFTTDDWTCYHLVAAAPALETLMDLESDRFRNLAYTVEAFQKEAGAVLGEYNKNFSVPFMSIHEKLRDTAFDRHTYKHTTMGFLKDIEAMPRQYEYSLKFFERWYRPENCVLVIAGDVKPERALELARKYYGPWKKGTAVLSTPQEAPQAGERTAHIDWKNPTLASLVLAWHVPAFMADSVEDRSLDVLAAAAFSETSPLYKDLVLDKQWVESLRAGHEARRDPYLFSVMARVKDPSRVDAVREAIDAALEKLGKDPLPPERIAAVKSNIRYSFLAGLDTPQGVAETIASFAELTGDTSSIETTYSTFEKVTPESVREVAARFFKPEHRTRITLAQAKEAKR
jgi:zinc protease